MDRAMFQVGVESEKLRADVAPGHGVDIAGQQDDAMLEERVVVAHGCSHHTGVDQLVENRLRDVTPVRSRFRLAVRRATAAALMYVPKSRAPSVLPRIEREWNARAS